MSLPRTLISSLLVVSGMVAGALALALFSAGEVYEYQDSFDGVHLPQVDAIVCLAGGRGRITTAGDIWNRYRELRLQPIQGSGKSPLPAKPPVLYLSGVGSQATFQSVSRQLRRGVLTVVQPEDVVIEKESSNTEENALYLARYARERGWNSVLLVTSPYHMRRARLIFERVLEEERHPMKIETYSVFQEPYEPGEWWSSLAGVRVTLVEYLKLLAYRTYWRR